MPLWPAVKLMDPVVGVDSRGTAPTVLGTFEAIEGLDLASLRAPKSRLPIHEVTSITLRRGVVEAELWEWRKTVTRGEAARRTLWLEVANGRPPVRLILSGALPTRWQGRAPSGGRTPTETLSLNYEKITWKYWPAG